MPDAIYITASCIIGQQQVFKNSQSVFQEKDTDLTGFLTAAYRHCGIAYPKFFKMDNLAKLGWLATEILLKDSFDDTAYKPEEVGILLSNASSSLDADIRYLESTKDIASPALFVYTLPNIVIGEICIKHKFKGESAFFIFEDFDAAFTAGYVSGLLNNNILQACICGWTELIGKEHRAALFLVEKKRDKSSTQNMPVAFTKENLNQLYRLKNG